jgi:hypothetical protein
MNDGPPTTRGRHGLSVLSRNMIVTASFNQDGASHSVRVHSARSGERCCGLELLDHLLNRQHLREGRREDGAGSPLQVVPANTLYVEWSNAGSFQKLGSRDQKAIEPSTVQRQTRLR